MPKLLTKTKNSYLLRLNKGLYKKNLVKKAIQEDSDWVSEHSDADGYLNVKLNSEDKSDVLDWVNYLTYLHKE